MKMFKNKRESETTSENKKEVVSLQLIENWSNKKIKLLVVVMAIALVMFAVTMVVQNVVKNIIAPAVTNEKEITDIQFLWGNTKESLNRDDAIWKQANSENKIQKISSEMDYVRIRVGIPASGKEEYYTCYTSFAPLKVVMDGKTIYNNGFDNSKIVGNSFNRIVLSASNSTRNMEIYIYSPVGFQFKLTKSSSDGSWYSSLNGLGLSFAFGMFLISLILIIMLVTISIKDKNIIKILMLSFVLMTGAMYLTLYQLGMSTTITSNGVFFSLQLILAIYFSVATLVCSLVCLNYRFKMWQNVSVIATLAASLILTVVESPNVLLVLGIIFAIIICGMFGLFIIRAIELIEKKVPFIKVATAVFAYICLINIYNIIALVTGTRGINRTVPILGATVYVITMYVVLFKQSVNHTIRIRERENQNLENAMNIERIAGILSDVAEALTDSQFAMYVCQLFTDVIIRNEMIASKSAIKAGNINISASVALRSNDDKYEEVYNMGNIYQCDYDKIVSMYESDKSKKIKFGQTYMDLVFIRNGQIQIILHIENFTNGMSEILQSTVKTMHNVLEIAFSNYNLRSRIKTVQEDAIISLAEIVELKGRQNKIHLYSVSAVTNVLCKRMNMPEDEVRMVSMAAIAHDIGKIAIPNEILNSEKKLTEEQFEIMKNHVSYGYNILSKIHGDFMEAAAVIAYQHHENYDGTGYMGLMGSDIHLYARIVKVADVYDALASERVYKKAWDVNEVRKYINNRSGVEFDPAIVKVFDENFDEVVEASKVAREKYGK